MNVVLLGPPGAGKGTQARALVERHGLLHLSTGEVLREAIRAGTDLGRQVQAIVESGKLAPDELVSDVVGERLDGAAGRGFLFDGFPRTVAQATLLDALLEERGLPRPVVLQLTVPEEEVVRRLARRRSCPRHGEPPAGSAACPRCSEPLASRADDAEEVVRRRLAVYREQTLPLSEHYALRGTLVRVDGTGTPEAVWERLDRAVAEVARTERPAGA